MDGVASVGGGVSKRENCAEVGVAKQRHSGVLEARKPSESGASTTGGGGVNADDFNRARARASAGHGEF